MDIGIGIRHENSLSQQLNLAPQLLQWLNLLQTSALDLSTMVHDELQSNPALETATADSPEKTEDKTEERDEKQADEEISSELLDLEDWEDGTSRLESAQGTTRNTDADELHQYLMDSISHGDSLYEHLLKQLSFSDLPKSLAGTAEAIVGSLDERGYLPVSIDELAIDLAVPVSEVEEALAAVQSLEPAGIAARDLRECLLLQMGEAEAWDLPRTMVSQYLEALGRHHYDAIAEAMDIEEAQVEDALLLIRTLDPAPGKAITEKAPQYITADVVVEKRNDDYAIEIQDRDIPPLRISASCKRLLRKGNLGAEEMSYIREKIRSANFLINGIRQRQQTVRKVAEHIVSSQQQYFDSPEGRLNPLTMARIAAHIGVHETTVSRAVANKYMQTPRGLFEMKHFFRSGYRCADGSALTPEAVKELIAEMFASEDADSPHRDVDIVASLKKKGLRVARRTVAKYRMEMGIPSSKERLRTQDVAA